jgi:hypothetical protein
MKSKIVEYEGKKAILSIARNISERKALQKELFRPLLKPK